MTLPWSWAGISLGLFCAVAGVGIGMTLERFRWHLFLDGLFRRRAEEAEARAAEAQLQQEELPVRLHESIGQATAGWDEQRGRPDGP